MRWSLLFAVGALFLVSFAFAYVVNDSPSKVHIFNFKVLADTYDGNTTNFSQYNESQLRNLSGVILERTAYGNISFNEPLDLVSMAGDDGVVNFDRDVNISYNAIFVYNDNLTGIDKSVNLSLYGLTYTDPVIYHNGVECSDCSLISYSGGNIIFSSPSFTGLYYVREKVTSYCGDGTCDADEDCSSCEEDCGACSSGGGGGGGTTTPTEEQPPVESGVVDFKVDPGYFSVKMKKGTYYQKWLNITNNGTVQEKIVISVDKNLSTFIFPEPRFITLNPGESKLVRLDVYFSKQRYSGIYPGQIILSSGAVKRNVDVVLDVRDRNALFDVRVHTLKKYFYPGGRVRANITVINMGDVQNFDVEMTYKIIDFNKKLYTIKQETFAINRTYNSEYFLDLPINMPVGNFIFYVEVNGRGASAYAFDTFTVEIVSLVAWILVILIILVLMYLIYRWYKNKKVELAQAEMKRIAQKKAEEATTGKLMKEGIKVKEGKIEVPELP